MIFLTVDDSRKWPTVSLPRPVTARPPHCGSRTRRIGLRIRCARGNRLKKDSSLASVTTSIQDKDKYSVTIPDTPCAETIQSVSDHVPKGDGSDCRPHKEMSLSNCSHKLTPRKPVTVSSSSLIEAKPLTTSPSMTIVKPLTVSSPPDAKYSTATSSLIDSKPLTVSTLSSIKDKSTIVVSSPTSATPLTVKPTPTSLTCRGGNTSCPLLNAASTPIFDSFLDESLASFLSIHFNDLRVSSRSTAGRSSSLNSHSSSCLVVGNFPIGAEMCLRQQNDTPIQRKPLGCNESPSKPSAFLGRVDLWKESFEPT